MSKISRKQLDAYLERVVTEDATVVVASLTEVDRDDLEAALAERAPARRAQ